MRTELQKRILAVSLMSIPMTASCASPPSSKPSPATTTASMDEVKLADAKTLNDFQSEDVQINLTDKITFPTSDDPVYFGEADEFEGDNTDTAVAAIPVIAIHPGSIWKALPLVGSDLENAGWKYVGTGPGLNEVWGVLDTTVGDTQPNFVLAHSVDGAATFTLKVFHKPCKLAVVSDFAMSRSGRGRVTVTLDADYGIHKTDHYHYETVDRGKTWSDVPRYEPDSMMRSDTVPDSEQPSEAPGTTRTVFRALHLHSLSR